MDALLCGTIGIRRRTSILAGLSTLLAPFFATLATFGAIPPVAVTAFAGFTLAGGSLLLLLAVENRRGTFRLLLFSGPLALVFVSPAFLVGSLLPTGTALRIGGAAQARPLGFLARGASLFTGTAFTSAFFGGVTVAVPPLALTLGTCRFLCRRGLVGRLCLFGCRFHSLLRGRGLLLGRSLFLFALFVRLSLLFAGRSFFSGFGFAGWLGLLALCPFLTALLPLCLIGLFFLLARALAFSLPPFFPLLLGARRWFSLFFLRARRRFGLRTLFGFGALPRLGLLFWRSLPFGRGLRFRLGLAFGRSLWRLGRRLARCGVLLSFPALPSRLFLLGLRQDQRPARDGTRIAAQRIGKRTCHQRRGRHQQTYRRAGKDPVSLDHLSAPRCACPIPALTGKPRTWFRMSLVRHSKTCDLGCGWAKTGPKTAKNGAKRRSHCCLRLTGRGRSLTCRAMNVPFWKTKSLEEMNTEEWESLCDGCGKCCLAKLEDEDTGEIHWTTVGCRLFDAGKCRCSDYENRLTRVSDCVRLTPEAVRSIRWLPATCAYRLVAEGKDLYPWHHLLSGSRETVHEAGISMRGRVKALESALDQPEDYFAYILDDEP